jgi:hypothetical protein
MSGRGTDSSIAKAEQIFPICTAGTASSNQPIQRQIGGSRSLPVATSGSHPSKVPGPRSVWPPSAARLPSGRYLAAPAT